MKPTLLLSVLASAAVSLVAAEELGIKVTQAVECDRKTQKGDKVHMHYHGSLADSGKKFDASYDRNKPLSFKLGSGQVIKGTLTIPPELGYGQRAMGPIPAGSTLIFETELVGIDGVETPEKIVPKVVEEEAEPAKENVAEKVASVASEAAEAAKTFVADTDDVQGHEEL
ncbi:Peptidyl-prolyl cis-trans isomerase fpr2 [Amphichorda felina]